MIAIASLTCLGLGTAIATLAPRSRFKTESLETFAGVLLVAGLAVLGAGLPLFR